MDLEKAARAVSRIGADYSDVRVIDSSSCSVRAKDDEVEATEFSGTTFGIRVLAKGSWGFASSTRESDLEKAMKRALSLARCSRGKSRMAHENKTVSVQQGKKTSEGLRKGKQEFDAELHAKECLALGKEALATGAQKYSAFLARSHSQKMFANSEGTFLVFPEKHAYLSVTAFARKGERLEQGRETKAALASSIEGAGMGGKAAGKALRMLEAKPCPNGAFTAILDGELAGVLCHEAMGHACEADGVLAGNSILAGKIGKQVASGQVTIIDDATSGNFGSYKFDDEGVRPQRKVLVEKGMLRGFLHSRETASEFKCASTGNARAGSASEFPVVRMSNTYFAKGDFSHEDVFGVKSGVYLKGMKGGSVDPLTGSFLFAAEEGFEISKGEIGAPLRDCSISGDILKTLFSVEAIGKDFFSAPGFCGKAGQSVPVSDGGPHMRIRNLLLG